MKDTDQYIKNGYVVTPDGVLKHREVYTAAHGQITPGWVIHHIDHDKVNNAIDNLIALPDTFHKYIHRQMRQEGNRVWTRGETERALERYLTQTQDVPKQLSDIQTRLKDLRDRIMEMHEQEAGLMRTERSLKQRTQEYADIPISDGRWRQCQNKRDAKAKNKIRGHVQKRDRK